ncbi:hypothetical protein F6455_16535 [Proteobacteria bacterium 005FR1]|nr:hypothetical protein [Proteobacteria bacterium 005FR1]
MTLRIRQIVLAARDLEQTVAQLTSVLGLQVCYRDPGVAEFGLANALMPIGDQFLEVVSPTRPDTAAGRHLDRHGDSGYMLLLQTDDFPRDRARFDELGVRTIWESKRPDIAAVHLHPKDIGAAIVSVDQPQHAADWPWAGPNWRDYVSGQGAKRVLSVTVGAVNPTAMASQWAKVLDTSAPTNRGEGKLIELNGGELRFESAPADVLSAFELLVDNREAILKAAREQGLQADGDVVRCCGTDFRLSSAS